MALVGESNIYFVQCTGSRLIKIGRSGDVRARLATLQSQSAWPLCLLASFASNGYAEKFLHRRFADARRSGEWFEPCEELLAFIRDEGWDAPEFRREIDSITLDESIAGKARTRLRELVEADGRSQVEIAAAVGMKQGNLSRMLSYDHPTIQISYVGRLLNVMGLPWAALDGDDWATIDDDDSSPTLVAC